MEAERRDHGGGRAAPVVAVLVAVIVTVAGCASEPTQVAATEARGPASVPRAVGADSTVGPSTTPAAATRRPAPRDTGCRSEATASFAVTFRYRAPTFPTPRALARVWRRNGERVWVAPSVSEDIRLVAIGRDRRAPREVLVELRLVQGWYLKRTIGCLERSRATDHCPTERVTLRGRRYRLQVDPPGTAPGVGRILGQAAQHVCLERAGQVLRSRGPVSPITAYGVNEQPASEAFAVTRNRTVRHYVAAG